MVIAVISPNAQAQDIVATALERSGRVDAVWSLPAYPEPQRLKDLPDDPEGCIVFLDFSQAPQARAVAQAAREHLPSTKLVAMVPGRGAPPPELAQLGIRGVAGLPPSAIEIQQLFADLCGESEAAGQGRIFAFLPAKPGAGATTLAVHAAGAAARLSNERVLLADFDFRLGMTSFLLKLSGTHSVMDALAAADQLEESWRGLVDRKGSMDVLGSAPQDLFRSDPERGTSRVLGYARRLYSTIVVDLPGEMRAYEVDTLRRATECLLVCTADISVMHMAQKKAAQLRSLGFEGKTSVILNRAGGLRMMPTQEVESILQLPVRFSVANAEKEIAAAIQTASALEGRTPVVSHIENIARHLLPNANRAEAPARRSLLELFGGSGRGRTAVS